MKKIQLLLMLWTLFLPLSAHTDATNETFTLTLKAVPEYATNISTPTSQVAAGKTTYVVAPPQDGFRFLYWKRGDEVVSTTYGFEYKMPAEDVELTAYFEFDPDGPGDPEQPNYRARHQLTLKASPEYAGTVSAPYEYEGIFRTGYQYLLQAQAKEGYRFLYWKENGLEVSQQYSFYYTMPDRDVELTAFFKYDPDSPGNPGGNLFDETTGLLILDDFLPGKMSEAIRNTVSNYYQVLKVIVKGLMLEADFNWMHSFTNLVTADLTHAEITTINSSFASLKKLTEVLLPYSVEKINDGGFRNCTSLSQLTLLAPVPPVVSSYTFSGVNTSEVMLYVPAASVPLYEEAEVWKDFYILPIDENIAHLNILLPDNASDGRYRNTTIQVFNVQTGQTHRYVVTNRMAYSFPVLTNCTYNVSLTGAGNAELGRWMGIDVQESDVSLTLTDAKVPQTFTLTILEPNGMPTRMCNVTWTDGSGNYIGSGQEVKGLVPGQQLTAHITLGEQLATRYQIPADQTYTVAETGNSEQLTLAPFGLQTVSGTVTDANIGTRLAGATVAVSQMLNGQTKVTPTVTDANGTFQMEVAKIRGGGQLTVSCDGYFTHQQPVDVNVNANVNIAMKPITGPVITLTANYTENGLNPSDRKTTLYRDVDDLAVSVEGHTFTLQWPLLIVTDDAQPGDVLTLKTSSRTDAFLPVTTQVTLDDDGHADATIDILEPGDAFIIIPAPRQSVTAMLYDGDGRLVRTATFPRDSRLQLRHLTDGDYTVVAMTQSEFFGSIDALSRYDELGLQEGTDYVKGSFSICSSERQYVELPKVPVFDESRFYYTGPNTSFTANRRSLAAGTNMVLKAVIDVKEDIRSRAANMQLVIPMPEGTSFIENTVVRAGKTVSYTYENQTLTIPVEADAVPICFSVMPTVSSKQSMTAYVQMRLDGATVMQPIGQVAFSTMEMIEVPASTSNGRVYVNGTAKADSHVDVYVDGQLVGSTTAKADGLWSMTHQLADPRNLSQYAFYAVITTPDGTELKTATKQVQYRIDDISVEMIRMSLYNPETAKTYEIDYDMGTHTVSSNSYVFYYPDDVTGGTEFTFLARLAVGALGMDNVNNLTFHVYTSDDRFTDVDGTLDTSTGLWVGKKKFTQYNLPLCVSATVSLKEPSTPVMDERTLTDAYQIYQDMVGSMIQRKAKVDALTDQLKALPADAYGGETYNSLMQQLMDVAGIDPGSMATAETTITDDELATIDTSLETLLSDDMVRRYTNDANYQYAEITQVGDLVPGMTFATADGLTAEQLLADGFEEQLTTGGSFYVKYAEGLMEFVDLKANIHMKVGSEEPAVNAARRAGGGSDCDGAQEEANQAAQSLTDMANKVKDAELKLMDVIKQVIDALDKKIAECRRIRELLDYQLDHYNLSMAERLAKLSKKLDVIGTEIALLGVKEDFGFFKSAKFMKVMGAASLVNDIYSAINDINDLASMFCGIPECDPPCEGAAAMKGKLRNTLTAAIGYNLGKIACDVAGMTGMFSGVVAELGSAGTASAAALPAIAASAIEMAISWSAGELYNTIMGSKKFYLQDDIDHLDCECDECKKDPESCEDDDDDDDDDDNDDNDDDKNHPKYPQVTPIIDPSGYVYEAVSSNRVEGVMATIYYKEEREDQYGDIVEEEVMWDAEEYAQVNPLFTDAQGMYQWDVPQGMWQVRFRKEGYEPMQSEWLPVPPPQLDINLPITQLSQPEVSQVHAYTDGTVELTFDKYMQPATLTDSAIRLTKTVGGEQQLVEVDTLLLPDLEVSYEGAKDSYARTVQLTTKEDLSQIKEVTLVVDRGVKSYAGITMQSVFQQTIDVEQRISQLQADSLVMMPNGSEMTVTISALPVETVQGRRLTVTSRSESIVTTDVTTATFNEQGEATVTLHACQPGRTAVEYGVEGFDAKVSTLVDVYVRGNGKVTIGLEQGWNWVSHWLYSPVRPQNSYLEQILSQQGEVSVLGSMTANKVKAATATLLKAEGPLLENSEKTAMLAAGWNWVAWPYERSARLAEAIPQAEEGDVITSQTDFATYEDGLWSGSLTLLRPRQGYLYKSVGEKPLHYVGPVERTSIAGQTEPAGPWSLDVHSYADVMNIVAYLYDGSTLTEGCTVGVFDSKGTCRGISQSIGPRLFLNVYGTAGETLYLRAILPDDSQYDINETMTFTNDVMGSRTAPVELHMGVEVGIDHPSWMSTRPSVIYSTTGQRINSQRKGVNIITNDRGQVYKLLVK